MSLDGALSISGGGLANVALGLSVISQNVANASTPAICGGKRRRRSVWPTAARRSGCNPAWLCWRPIPGCRAR